MRETLWYRLLWFLISSLSLLLPFSLLFCFYSCYLWDCVGVLLVIIDVDVICRRYCCNFLSSVVIITSLLCSFYILFYYFNYCCMVLFVIISISVRVVVAVVISIGLIKLLLLLLRHCFVLFLQISDFIKSKFALNL